MDCGTALNPQTAEGQIEGGVVMGLGYSLTETKAEETSPRFSADGNRLSAYLVKPEGTPRGAVVVIQEIFGVNSHIRRVAEQYAAEGYLAIAPAMFDRLQKGVELGYDPAGLQAGIDLMMKATNEGAIADMNAAIDAVSHAGAAGLTGRLAK